MKERDGGDINNWLHNFLQMKYFVALSHLTIKIISFLCNIIDIEISLQRILVQYAL